MANWLSAIGAAADTLGGGLIQYGRYKDLQKEKDDAEKRQAALDKIAAADADFRMLKNMRDMGQVRVDTPANQPLKPTTRGDLDALMAAGEPALRSNVRDGAPLPEAPTVGPDGKMYRSAPELDTNRALQAAAAREQQKELKAEQFQNALMGIAARNQGAATVAGMNNTSREKVATGAQKTAVQVGKGHDAAKLGAAGISHSPKDQDEEAYALAHLKDYQTYDTVVGKKTRTPEEAAKLAREAYRAVKGSTGASDPLKAQALKAIADGRDPAAVKARYTQLTGKPWQD